MWNLMYFQDMVEIKEAMELIAACMVFSMTRTYYFNMPVKYWQNLTCACVSWKALPVGLEYCCFWTYAGVAYGCGECCGFLGSGC